MVKKTERLFELMLTLNKKKRFTVQELADEFAVSKRTMMRDLHALSEMGVPLLSMPGLHGGYEMLSTQSLPQISFTLEEVIGLILSYEALDAYAESPFQESQLSAMTKLKAVLPSETLEEVEQLREYIGVDVPKRAYSAPYLQALLEAAKQHRHLEIDYTSYSGPSRRLIYPYGVIASNGFWYCPAYCYKRKELVWFRADRIQGMSEAKKIPDDHLPTITMEYILEKNNNVAIALLHLEAQLTQKGRQFAEWHPQLARFVNRLEDGTGIIEMDFPKSNVEMTANLLLSLGNEVEVISPQEVRDFLKNEALKLVKKYEQ